MDWVGEVVVDDLGIEGGEFLVLIGGGVVVVDLGYVGEGEVVEDEEIGGGVGDDV